MLYLCSADLGKDTGGVPNPDKAHCAACGGEREDFQEGVRESSLQKSSAVISGGKVTNAGR